mgnify:CR=1 FL=1
MEEEKKNAVAAEEYASVYRLAGFDTFVTSSADGEGIEALSKYITARVTDGKCAAFAGASGVGKSSLLNALFPALSLEVGEISEKIQRGKNTTRHAQMLIHDGIRVLDTAGFSLLELDAKMEPDKLRECYPEFVSHEGCCRFTPCMHDREPGCSVTAAVQAGEIDQGRVERYRLLLSDVRETWKQRYN